MSDVRTDTTEARPREASAQAAAAGTGRHRGPASPHDHQGVGGAAHGKHRREAD